MRLPRFTTRRLMALVAAFGLLLGAGVVLLRPYPIRGAGDGSNLVDWSDGSVTSHDRASEVPFAHLQPLGPFVWVMWSDGRNTLHLKTVAWRRKHHWYEAQILVSLCALSIMLMISARRWIAPVRRNP